MRNEDRSREMRWINCTGIILLLIMMPILLSQLLLMITYHRIDAADRSLTGDNILCFLQHEDNPLDSSLQKFDDLYQNLLKFEYFELYSQPIYQIDDDKAHFDSNSGELSESCESVRCEQISDNVLDEFGLTIIRGERWKKEDFLLDNNCLPVLLGCGYDGIYEPGDEFRAEYLFDYYSFYVIGFLEAGSVINTPQKYIDLNNAIVMPSFSVQEDADAADGLLIHYANKTSGLVKMQKGSFTEAVKELETITDSSEAGTYSCNFAPLSVGFQKAYGFSILQVIIVLALAEGVCAILVLWLLYRLRSKYRTHMKERLGLFGLSAFIYCAIALICLNSGRLTENIVMCILLYAFIWVLHLRIKQVYSEMEDKKLNLGN